MPLINFHETIWLIMRILLLNWFGLSDSIEEHKTKYGLFSYCTCTHGLKVNQFFPVITLHMANAILPFTHLFILFYFQLLRHTWPMPIAQSAYHIISYQQEQRQ